MLHPGDKILTWHPAGKKGVYIAKKDYDLLCEFILTVLRAQEITLKDLIEMGDSQLALKIDRDISWQILVVKLDLEARGLITTVLKLAPYKLQFLKLSPGALKKYSSTFRGPNLVL